MAKAKGKGAKREAAQQPTPPTHDEMEEDSDVDIIVDGQEAEKDETEMELEKLVFGDSNAFREGLGNFSLDQEEADDDEDDDAEEASGIEGLDDADLFFTDTGDAALAPTPAEGSSDEDEAKQPTAWVDSDDERMMVSLATAPRLRKLRRTEAEDIVDGREYAKRLRRQFELLNPRPAWAQHALEKPARKKRRISEHHDADELSSDGEEMDMDDDDAIPSVAPLSKLLQDAESLVRSSGPSTGKKRKLRPEVINIQRTADIGTTQPSAITSLSFHPTLPLLLSSGPSSTLYLHHLTTSPSTPTPNPLLTSLHIRNTPLTTTAFHPTDSRIFLSARRRYFHIWNLSTGRVEKIARVYGHQHEQRSMETFKLSPDGRYMALLGSARKGGGVINILSAATLQWTTQLRVESRGGIADFAWWRDSTGLCVAGKSGEVTEWSLQHQSIIARWQDEGAVGTTVIALGGVHEFLKSPIGHDRWVVVGSSSGIVNIYDRRAWLSSSSNTQSGQSIPPAPKPTRTLDQLTTPTSHLAFSPDGQLLAVASKWKRDALRLVHLPSCTVFRNWPTSRTPLGRITGVAFGEGRNMGEGEGDVVALLAVANERGKIGCWEVR